MVPWGTGHGVGYWAHDVGPGLSRRETRLLAPGQVFAFDSFFAWAEPGSDSTWGNRTYLVPPQRELVLIKSR
jgi:hypothetical protein